MCCLCQGFFVLSNLGFCSRERERCDLCTNEQRSVGKSVVKVLRLEMALGNVLLWRIGTRFGDLQHLPMLASLWNLRER
jgi:hypothetical protein